MKKKSSCDFDLDGQCPMSNLTELFPYTTTCSDGQVSDGLTHYFFELSCIDTHTHTHRHTHAHRNRHMRVHTHARTHTHTHTHTHIHTHTHTHADSNPLLWLTYLISLTMFSCNDDHFRAAPSGYPHQVIHISNTQGTSEQVSSPRGGGPDT